MTAGNRRQMWQTEPGKPKKARSRPDAMRQVIPPQMAEQVSRSQPGDKLPHVARMPGAAAEIIPGNIRPCIARKHPKGCRSRRPDGYKPDKARSPTDTQQAETMRMIRQPPTVYGYRRHSRNRMQAADVQRHDAHDSPKSCRTSSNV